MPNHPVAYLEAKGSPPEAESVTIHLLESDLEPISSVAEREEPEICSEQGSTEWESSMEVTQCGEDEANNLALLKCFNFLPGEGQPHELNNEADPFILS